MISGFFVLRRGYAGPWLYCREGGIDRPFGIDWISSSKNYTTGSIFVPGASTGHIPETHDKNDQRLK